MTYYILWAHRYEGLNIEETEDRERVLEFYKMAIASPADFYKPIVIEGKQLEFEPVQIVEKYRIKD